MELSHMVGFPTTVPIYIFSRELHVIKMKESISIFWISLVFSREMKKRRVIPFPKRKVFCKIAFFLKFNEI